MSVLAEILKGENCKKALFSAARAEELGYEWAQVTASCGGKQSYVKYPLKIKWEATATRPSDKMVAPFTCKFHTEEEAIEWAIKTIEGSAIEIRNPNGEIRIVADNRYDTVVLKEIPNV